MNFKTHQNRLSQLSARFNLMVFLVFGLLVSNILLSILIFIAWSHHTVEITPFSGGSSYIKSASFVDSHYLRLMTENFINERLNVSPETVDANHKRLLSFINSRQYADFLKQLATESRIIKEQNMSSNFEITAPIRVNTGQLSAQVRGRLKRFVGIQFIDDAQRTYNLQFKYANGHLSIIQFVLQKEEGHA